MILRLKLLILTLTILLFGLNVQAVETLISPVSGSSPGEIRYFTDKSGRLNLVYQYDHNEKISEIFYLIHENEKWSSPIKIEFPFSNQKTLYDIKTLSGGSPLLIFGGDTTDYAKVLNIPNPADISTDANNQLDLGLPQSDLIKLLKDNQRLFFSLQSKGSWTSPIPIMDSYGAFDPVAAVGPNNNALLAFRKDLDGNSETKNDIEIFITSFSGTLWSKPFRLTNNAVYEGGIQLKWTNQGYLLIWVADNNSALYSSSYKTINSAIFSSSGELSSSPSLVVSAPQKSPMPILGSIGGEGRLIWASEKASETDSRRPLWESRFSGSWSEKVETGLFSYQPNNGDLFVVGNRTFLVYQDGSSIKVALNNGSGWSSGGSSITFDWSKINFIDSAFQLDQNGVLKVAFSGSLTQSADPDESMSGIYHSTFPLQSDLAISGFKTQSSTHVINGNVGVQFSVYNAGFLGSGVYQIQVKNEDNLLQTFEETTLSPGAFKEFEFSFKLLKPSFPIKILLLPTTEDNNEANNQFSTSINVLPDYIVSKVYKKDSGTIIAKIKETRKVAAPPVKVNFYSLVESDRKLIGSGDFDPNSNMPLVVSWPEMATLQSPFRIIVEVNADRSVKESSYSNNQGTFSFTPKADFSIKYLNVTKSSIYLTVSNLGDKYVDKVDLLLTDNPLIAGQSNISAGQKPLFYDLVGFENSMEKRMVFNRNSIEEIKGDYLYAVINPYGSISESSRNNNQLRTILSLSDMGGGNDSTSDSTDDGGTGGEEPGEDPYNDMTTKLEFSNSSQWCGTL
ncbi:hypothetical protein KKA14_20010, partial [bacterium]|nr:hypothetical protein [bacterium]